MKKLQGVVPAVPTTLDANEDLDGDAFRRLLDFVVEGGADGVFVLGSMGEGPSLVDEQKTAVVQTAVRHLDGSVPVLAGISEISTRRSCRLGELLADAGPDYLVVTTGAYYGFPDPESTRRHVETLSTSLPLPVIFYNVPARTGNPVDTETALGLLRLPNVHGIKDSSRDFPLVMSLIRSHPDKDTRPFVIFQGDEAVYDVSIMMGADGVITGGGTLFVPLLKKLYAAASAGDRETAFGYQREFSAKMSEMLGTNPAVDWVAAVKHELEKRGIGTVAVTEPFLNRFAGR